MTQAQFQALIMEVQNLKSEIKNYMSTTDLEKQNLEAHVDLCSERYKGLHDRLSAIEVRLGKMNEEMTAGHKSTSKTIIATAGTVVAGLLSTVVAAFYYLRLIKIMYFDEQKEKYDTDHGFWLYFSFTASTFLILIYLIFPSQLIEVVSRINII